MNSNGTFGFEGFDQVDAYYRSASNLAGGSASGFTALLALELRDLCSTAVTMFGNTDNSVAGWDFRRLADSAGTAGTITVGVRAGDGTSLVSAQVSIPKDSAWSRTVLLGLTVSGTLLSLWIDGAVVATETLTAAFNPNAGLLAFGNRSGSVAAGAVDRLISGAYVASVLSETQMIQVWENFRKLGTLAQAGVLASATFNYVYDTINASTPRTPAPATLPNTGSNTGGALTYQSASAALTGSSDFEPAYTASLGTGSAGTQPSNIYVSAANGNDANNGLTPATAVATDARAKALVPSTLTSPLVIHYAAGTYAWAPIPSPLQLSDSARIWLIGDGAGQAGDDGFTVIGTDVAGAGTDANQIVTTALAPALNAYQSFTIEVLDGPAAGYRRTVLQNAAGAGGAIYPVRRYESQDATTAVVPVAGNAFRIVRPAVIFTGIDTQTGSPGFLEGIGKGDGGSPLFLVNLAFAATTGGSTGGVEINGCTIYGAGIEWRGSVFPNLTDCAGSFGMWDHQLTTTLMPRSTPASAAKAAWFADIGRGTSLTNLAQWRGWGWSVPDVVASATNAGLFNTCVMSLLGTFGGCRYNGSVILTGGYFWGSPNFNSSSGELVGRAPAASAVADNTTFARQLILAASSVRGLTQLGSVTFLSGSTNIDMSGSGCFLVLNGGISCTNTTNNPFISMGAGCRLSVSGTVTISNATTSTNRGAFYLSGSGSYIDFGGATLSITMTGGGVNAIYAIDNAGLVVNGATLITDGDVYIRRGAVLDIASNTVNLAGTSDLVVENARVAMYSGALNMTGASTNLIVTDGGIFDQADTALVLNGGGSFIIRRGGKHIAHGAASITVTNGGVAQIDASELIFDGSGGFVYTSSGDFEVSRGGKVVLTDPLTISGGGRLNIQSGSEVVQSANITISGTAGTPFLIGGNSKFTQIGGTLSSVATAGDGASITGNSRALFSGGANTVLTGAGGTNVGLRIAGGSTAWYSGALTNTQGVANGVDVNGTTQTNAATAALAAAAYFVDATGAGNVVGRV